MRHSNPWDAQRAAKYEKHDFSLDDMKPLEREMIASRARDSLIRDRECDVVKLTIAEFMAHLSNNGFRIVKESK